MNTRNLLESDNPVTPWLLAPAFFAVVLALIALLAASPVAAGIVAVALAVLLTVTFIRMGRRA